MVMGRRGPSRRFCSPRCRTAAHRERKRAANAIPAGMRERVRWVRADGKRPIRADGRPASSTDPSTWAMFEDVQTGAGDGFGVMLGSGLGCYDLDDVTDAQAREFADGVAEPVVFVERSMSGRGVHVFIEANEASGWKRTVNGISVERYTRGRFIRMTGVALDF